MIKTQQEIATMHRGGKILGRILKTLAKEVRHGVSTKDLNELAERLIKKAGACPAFKGYKLPGFPPFPCALCASINEEVVHSPAVSERILKEGDIIGLDLGLAYYKNCQAELVEASTVALRQAQDDNSGMFVDSAVTVGVGKVSKQARQLIKVTKKSLDLAILQVKPGNTTGDIGYAIQKYIEKQGFSVIRELVGHGVGHSVHEPPPIPNFGRPGTGEKLKPGMGLAIEPMSAIGDWKLKFYPGKWRVTTKDKSLSAHFEHTVLVTKKGCEILTKV